MKDPENKRNAALAWLQANAKTILLALDAALVLVLLYFAFSHVLFRMRVNRLMDTAEQIEAHEAKDTEPDEGRGRGPQRPDRERPGAKPTTATAGTEKPSSPTAVTSGTVAKGEAAATTGPPGPLASRATSPAVATTGPIAAVLESPSTSALATSGGVETLPTTGSLAGTATMIAARQGSTVTTLTTGTAGSSRPIARWLGTPMDAIRRRMASARRPGDRSPGDSDRDSSRRPRSSGRPDREDDSEDKENFDQLAQRGLFGAKPPAPKKPQLEAILFGAALVGDKWLRVGDKLEDEKVVEIETNKIVLEDPDGKRREMTVLAGGSEGRPSGGPRRPSGPPGGPGGPQGAPSASASASVSAAGPREPVRMDGEMREFRIPDQIFERLTGPGGRFEGMSREELMERFREMRERARERGGGPRRGMRPRR